MKILRIILLFIITLNIALPQGSCAPVVVGLDTVISIDNFVDSESDASDDQPEENCNGKKVDAAEKFFTIQRFSFSTKFYSVSFIESLPTFIESYVPKFHVPPARLLI